MPIRCTGPLFAGRIPFALATIVVGIHSAQVANASAVVEQPLLPEASETVPSAPPLDAPTDSTVVYPATFFAAYNPSSANDMIDRIPGVSLGGGGGGRGLGTGGDLLINGQRIAGKDNSPSNQLSRIAAREVDRIEIIRGTSADLDVRGSGQVVNVVLLEAHTRSSTSVEVNADHHHDGTVQPGGSVSHSRQVGDFQALLNFEADPRYMHQMRDEYNEAPDGSILDIIDESNVREQTAYELSSTMSYRTGPHTMQLNTLYGDSAAERDRFRDFTDFRTPGEIEHRAENELVDYDHYNWEIGGDYGHVFNDGGRFQFLFIVNDQTRDHVRERFSLENPRLSPEERDKFLFIESNQRTRERIAQSSYSWRLADSQDMQLGLERAQTILDSSLFVGNARGSSDPDPRYGNLPPMDHITNPGSTVEEMRYEGFAIHNWTLSDRMSLESSVVYETSEIAQSGQVSQTRDFNFIRPSIDYRFNVTNQFQVRATVERQVSQLSFANFSATVNTSDTERDADAGNPDLVPDKEMRYELTLEYRLPEDSGVLSSRFFLRDIEDHIGKIDASPSPDRPLSADGNVGRAQRWGVYLDASTRLGYLGLPDALVSSSLNIFDSKITDPFLGTEERINSRGNASLDFRHDVTGLGLNYGFSYRYPFNGGRYDIDIATITRNDRSESLSMFVSKTAFDGVTFRLESTNTLNSESCRERRRFTGTTMEGNLREIEHSCATSGRKLALKVRTTF